MKLSFTKVKNITKQLSFFWQVIVLLFFTGLIIILVAGVSYWFSLEWYLNPSSDNSSQGSDSLDLKIVSQVLEQIRDRQAEITGTTTNSSELIDPSR